MLPTDTPVGGAPNGEDRRRVEGQATTPEHTRKTTIQEGASLRTGTHSAFQKEHFDSGACLVFECILLDIYRLFYERGLPPRPLDFIQE